MDIYSLVSIGALLFLGFLYWLYTRRQVSTAKKEGNPVFENVIIRFDSTKNARIIASLMTIFAGSFAAAFVWLIAQKNGVVVIFLSIAAAYVFIYLLTYFAYRYVGFSANYNYSGLGVVTDTVVNKKYLISDHDGLHGLISFKWKMIRSATETSEKSIKLKTARPPKWLYDLFHMNETELVFNSIEDKGRFQSILKARGLI